MLYWGAFAFSFKMLFPDYERAVDIYLVYVAFFTKDRIQIVSTTLLMTSVTYRQVTGGMEV